MIQISEAEYEALKRDRAAMDVLRTIAPTCGDQIVASKVRHLLNHGPCMLAPAGWVCTRDAGHEGSCPGHPVGSNDVPPSRRFLHSSRASRA